MATSSDYTDLDQLDEAPPLAPGGRIGTGATDLDALVGPERPATPLEKAAPALWQRVAPWLPRPAQATLPVREMTPEEALGAPRPRYGRETEIDIAATEPVRVSDPLTELGRQTGLALFSNLGRIARSARGLVRPAPAAAERPIINPEDVTGSLARLGQEAAPSVTETARAFREAATEGQALAERIAQIERTGEPVPKALRREYEAIKARMAKPTPGVQAAEAPGVTARPSVREPSPYELSPPLAAIRDEGRFPALWRLLFGAGRSPEYRAWSRERRGALASTAEDVGQALREAKGATRAEAVRLGISRGEAGGRLGLALKGVDQELGPEAQAITGKLRQQIDANSRAMAERGIISEATEEAGRGTYARRVYARDILGGDEWSKVVPPDVKEEARQFILANNKVKIGPGQYRSPTLEEADALVDGIARGRVRQVNLGGKELNIPVGQTLRRKDIPEPIRRLMGEVEEGAYLGARTVWDQSRLLINHDFLKAFSEGREVIGGQRVPWMSKTPVPGYRAVPVNELVKRAMGAGATDKVYVVEKYAGDFARTFGPQSVDLFDKLYNPLLTTFKLSKTVLNPVTHLRNTVGNFMFADLADVFPLNPSNLKHYWDAARAIRTGDQLWKSALQHGAVGTEYGIAELGMVAREFLAPATPLQAAGRLALRPVKDLASLYNMEDQVFKLAAYAKQLTKGASPREAAAYVNKWFPNYQDVPDVVRLLREGKGSLIGSPFVSFAAEATRIGAQAAREQPLTLAKWLLAVPAASAAAAAYQGVSLDELRAGYKKLPPHLRTPMTMLLPWRDARGNLQVTDQTYTHPLGQILRGVVGGEPERGRLFNFPFLGEFVGGNPIVTLAYELGTNTNLSPFAHGEPVVRPSDRPIGKRVEHIIRTLGPSLTPVLPGVTERGGSAYEQIAKAMKGKPGRYGQYQTAFGALLGELTPARAIPIDQALARFLQRSRRGDLRAVDEEEARIKAEARRRLITPEQLQERMQRLRERKRKLSAP